MGKKIVFLIVEGPSDQDALEAIFVNMFNLNEVRVHVVHEDLTTKRIYANSSITKEINNILVRFMANYHLNKSDIQQIIQIIDMDGAYIPDNCVRYDSTLENEDDQTHICYTVTEIRTNKLQNVIDRNRIKRERIDEITRKTNIAGIPYQVYYMSYCLDHVLYDKLNSSDEEKETDSMYFAQKYKDDIDEFKRYMSESIFSVQGDYLKTWAFIKDRNNCHSLMRYSNLSLCWQTL